MNFKKLLINNRLLVRLIISYLITSILLTGILMVVVSGFVSSRIKTQITESAHDLLKQSYNTANYALTDIYGDYYTLWSKNKDIQISLNSTDISMEYSKLISNLIDKEAFRNDLIDSIYVINKKANIVITNTNGASTIDNFYDSNALELFSNFEKNYKVYKDEIFFPRKTVLNLYGTKQNKNFISMVYSAKDKDGNLTSGIVVNIDQDKISSLINVTKDHGYMIIVNGSGKIISDSRGNSESLARNGIYAEIAYNPNHEDNFIGNYLGEKSFITFKKAENLGFVFINITPYSYLEKEVEKSNSYMAIFFISAMIISLLVSFFSTKKIYEPLNDLIKDMKENPSIETYPSMDEYTFLGKTYNSLILKDKQSHVARIFKGNYSEATLEILGYIDNNKFITFAVIPDDEINTPSLLEDIISVINLNTNWAGAITAPNCVSYIITETSINERKIENIMEALINLQSVISNELNITVSIGLGTIVNSLDSIKFSHRYAMLAAQYAKQNGETMVVYYNDMENSKVAASQNKDNIADKIQEYILNNYTRQDFIADEISVELDLSLGYLRQIFKDEKGITLNEYIINCRINKAKNLLETTDETAKDIAEGVGYYDNRYFYTLFKKKVGMTTDEYRQLAREDSKNESK